MKHILGSQRPHKFFETNPPAGGAPPPEVKTVPEATYLALKQELEAAKSNLQAKLDAEVVNHSGSRAKVTELEAQIAALTAQVTDITALQTQLTTANEGRTALEARLIAHTTATLTGLGIAADKLKDKSLADLEMLASTLEGVTPGQGGRFDRGGGAGGATMAVRPGDRILQGIENGELHRVGGGSNSPV